MPDQLKNIYNRTYIDRLAEYIKKNYPAFDHKLFIQNIFDDAWSELELKPRLRHITLTLQRYLPENYQRALTILKKTAPHFNGFHAMFFPDYVEVAGLDDPETSVPALEYFTQFSSSEFAIRPFIIRYGDRIMRTMETWTHHESHHVRRLASEGCRPRLPWAMALPEFKKNPIPILPILEQLKADPSEYVRRSVANNLNDIAKDHPALVLEVTKKWYGKKPQTDWIVRHACRTLLKRGDETTLKFFGFDSTNGVSLSFFQWKPKSLRIGEYGIFSFQLLTKKTVKLRVEYTISFMKSSGKHTKKVFMIAEREFSGNSVMTFRKKHSFRDLTTRKHYPGMHTITILVNGQKFSEKAFMLRR